MDRNSCTAPIRCSPTGGPFQTIISAQQTLKTSSWTLFSLPREIRDQIYAHALVSESPIVVWKGEWDVKKVQPEWSQWRAGMRISWKNTDRSATVLCLQNLTLNILLCDKIVNQEATRIFYRENTFGFFGRHNWDPIVSWLECLGEPIRSYLTKLEIGVLRPDLIAYWRKARQMEEGTRYDTKYYLDNERITDTLIEIYPRHPYLQPNPDARRRGSFDNINPAIENLFILLGGRESKEKVTVTLLLDYMIFPGIDLKNWKKFMYRWRFSMDLPNLIEKFRTLHCENDQLGPTTEVRWKGIAHLKLLRRRLNKVRMLDWEVTTIENAGQSTLPYTVRGEPYSKDYFGRVDAFILKRKPLVEPLIAQDGSFYRGLYRDT